MFGSKKEKQERLQRMIGIIQAQGEVSHTELARTLHVSRQTVVEDLASLHDQRMLLCERHGKVSLLERWFRRPTQPRG
jgi:DeoR/GlpR family transcriptional regulator of sugar metabolism